MTKLAGANELSAREAAEKSAIVRTAVSTNRHSIPIRQINSPMDRTKARNIFSKTFYKEASVTNHPILSV